MVVVAKKSSDVHQPTVGGRAATLHPQFGWCGMRRGSSSVLLTAMKKAFFLQQPFRQLTTIYYQYYYIQYFREQQLASHKLNSVTRSKGCVGCLSDHRQHGLNQSLTRQGSGSICRGMVLRKHLQCSVLANEKQLSLFHYTTKYILHHTYILHQ